MTKIQLFICTLFISCFCFSVDALPTTQKQQLNKDVDLLTLLSSEDQSVDDILALTPKKYKETTGKRMKLHERLALKVVQHQLKSGQEGFPISSNNIDTPILLILCLIPPLAIYLVQGLSGSFWLSCLLILGSIVIGIIPLIGGFLGFLLYALAIAHAVLIVLN